MSTVDLLALTNLDHLLLTLKYFLFFFYKSSYPNEEVNCIKPFHFSQGFRDTAKQHDVKIERTQELHWLSFQL
jgi:hypothetical protein